MDIRLSERHIVALNFVLVAILAYFAALSVNDVVGLRITPGTARAGNAMGALSASLAHPRTYYQPIVARDIFNLVPQARSSGPVVVEDLHLNLVGVSQSKGKQFAIIEDRAGQQSVYQVGQMVTDAGKLVEVDKDRAIIDHRGRRVAINLPKDEPPTAVTSQKSIPVPAAIDSGDNDSSDADEQDSFDPEVTDLGNNKYQITRATVDHSLNNMSELFSQIRAVPNLQNGRTNGFALSEIEPGSVFDEMGFEDGDVINSVDGQTVADPAQAMQMIGTLRNKGQINVQVMRDGHPITLNYQVQ